jgi:hypothetical protein
MAITRDRIGTLKYLVTEGVKNGLITEEQVREALLVLQQKNKKAFGVSSELSGLTPTPETLKI